MKKVSLLATAAVAVALVVGMPVAMGGSTQTPGVTANLIKIGGTFPLTGAAASYAPIARGMAAYFSYINARRGPDKRRGIAGRQVRFIYYDDAYTQPQTVQQTRRLVEQDKVLLLLGGLGTEPQQAVREYLNAQKVPQLYVSTGATEFGAKNDQFRWTLGWQPDYQAEGALYGRRIAATTPNAKIAILYQNDDYGKDYIAGLETGLGAKKNQIVATRGYNVTDVAVTSQLVDLRRSGADTLVIFATPRHTIITYATLPRLGWKPENIYLNSVSATQAFMAAAVANAGAATVNGSISVQYLKDPAASEWDNDAGMKLYNTVMSKYLPTANAKDGLYLYGFAKAQSFINLMYKVGRTGITRDKVMRTALNFTETSQQNPFFLPGVTSTTNARDKFPISHIRPIRFNNGGWAAIGGLQNPRGR